MPRDAALQAPARSRAGAGWPGLVVFDCDGVLIDSEIVVCRLTAEELTRLGYAIATSEVIRRFAGRPEREMLAEIEAEWGRPVPAAYSAAMTARVAHAYAHELQVMPGAAELLRRLRVEVCVASSSHPEKLRLGLETVGLHDRFAPHVVSASLVAHGKPAPDVFVFAAGWMRTPVAQCLVIEDSVPGVQAARAAGMRVIGFAGGSHCGAGHGERLLAAGAEQVVARFEELDALVPGAF